MIVVVHVLNVLGGQIYFLILKFAQSCLLQLSAVPNRAK